MVSMVRKFGMTSALYIAMLVVIIGLAGCGTIPEVPTATPTPTAEVPTETSTPALPTETNTPELPTETSTAEVPIATTEIPTATLVPRVPTATSIPKVSTATPIPKVPTATSKPSVPTMTAVPRVPTATSVPQPVLPTSTPSSSQTSSEVQATLREWGLDLSLTEVPAGLVHFLIANTGMMAHNFTIRDANGVLASTSNFSPSQSPQTLDVTLQPGTYTVYCSLPGHAARGQQNTLVVK